MAKAGAASVELRLPYFFANSIGRCRVVGPAAYTEEKAITVLIA